MKNNPDVEIVAVSETPPETAIAFGGKRLELRKNINTGAWGVVLYLPAGQQDFPESIKCLNERTAFNNFLRLERENQLKRVYSDSYYG